MKIVTSQEGGGGKKVSPNDTWGGESKNGPKKCHVLFEWYLRLRCMLHKLMIRQTRWVRRPCTADVCSCDNIWEPSKGFFFLEIEGFSSTFLWILVPFLTFLRIYFALGYKENRYWTWQHDIFGCICSQSYLKI